MCKNGHTGISDIAFPASPGGPPGVEVRDFAGLAALARGQGVDEYSPVRPLCHLLMTVRTGFLLCSVDFTECVVSEGSWLWVRPGQVLRLSSDLTTAGGTVILFQPSFLGPATIEAAHLDRRAWRLPLAPTGGAERQVRQTLDLLEGEYRVLTDLPLEVHVDVVRHLLAVLVLRLAHLPGGQRKHMKGSEVFRRFQQAVERDFARSHRLEDYASELGYAPRTLTRATRAAVGCGAKRFLDDRVLLEARRLLVHTDLSTSAVGERLGFPGASVFTRFFRIRTAETPAAFRARSRGDWA